MVIVKPKRKPRFMCECEQKSCDYCGGGGTPIDLEKDNIYDLIKNPKPARIWEVTDSYVY